MFPKYVAKLYCGEWFIWFYAVEHLSVLVERKNSQLEAELGAAERNVQLYTRLLKGDTHGRYFSKTQETR